MRCFVKSLLTLVASEQFDDFVEGCHLVKNRMYGSAVYCGTSMNLPVSVCHTIPTFNHPEKEDFNFKSL